MKWKQEMMKGCGSGYGLEHASVSVEDTSTMSYLRERNGDQMKEGNLSSVDLRKMGN